MPQNHSITHQKLLFLCFVYLFLFIPTVSHAQLGPGGVSVETAIFSSGRCNPDTGSTCGLWLDASTLTSLADGDDVTLWPDVSPSYDCDDAVVPSGVFPPIFRNDPAYTINGLPTITFEDNRHFQLVSADDLNLNDVTFDKNVFISFRTSEDITTKQLIYEEGGTDRGFNIMIQAGDIIIGAYDKDFDNDDGLNGNTGNTPAWGYSYISKVIQPNTTYILTATFHADTYGIVANNDDYYLKGWLNGISFGGGGQLIGGFNGSGFTNQGKLGTLFEHPNPCGLGAVNDDSVNRDGVVNGQSGTLAFKGKLAELIYYKDELSETQRIIIENYLAAKYIAVLETNNFYDYDYIYGKDVIGIGRSTNPQLHNLSQGRNPFVISTPASISTSANQYYMTGHNGLNKIWTGIGVPNNSTNIHRLRRIWRVDRSSFNYDIDLKLDVDKLPPRPAGYSAANSKLVLLVDETSANIPDFTKSTTIVKELSEYSTAPYEYEIGYNFPQGSFYTFAWLKPEVSFVESQNIAIEADAGYSTKSVLLKLNYEPVNNGDATNDGFTVDYSLIAGTAILGPGPGIDNTTSDDFYYNSSTSGMTSDQISFPEGAGFSTITIRIINNDFAENPSTEDFSINITNTTSLGNAPELLIGSNASLEYTIYDDDADPKISFVSYATPIQYTEGDIAGSVNVGIIRNGTTGPVTCKVQVVVGAVTTVIANTSGLDPADYDNSFDGQIINFPAGGPVIETLTIPIYDDLVDEKIETLKLIIYDLTGTVSALSTPALYQVIQIFDNDIPVASFASPAQSGYESIGSPSLLVTLDPISSRAVTVNYSMTPGTASYGSDYSGFTSGSIIFPPFASEAYVGPFTVLENINPPPDPPEEGPETVLFNLTGTTPDGDPTLVQPSNMTYTILDYQPFEWQGVAGVGKSSDNIVWIDASQEVLGDLETIINRAPHIIGITKDGNPATNTANAINGKNAFVFNGSATPANADAYLIANSPKINTAGTVDRLSYYFVINPDIVPSSSATPTVNVNTNDARVLYKQGGSSRGTSIYLYNNKLYFHAWNNPNDDGAGDQAPWGHAGNGGSGNVSANSSLYAVSTQDIVAGTNYIVSCHYDNSNDTEPLMIYVNGIKGVMSNLNAGTNVNGVGRLWGHTGAVALGAEITFTLLHFTKDDLNTRICPFAGKIAEFISFHEPEMTPSRRVILENYLSAKYSIALDDSDTPQVWDFSDPEQDNFKIEIAGIGQESGAGSAHADSRGPNSILRINSPSFDGNNEGYLIWGNNGESLTNTWPYTNSANNVLPVGIEERSGQVWKVFERGTVTSVKIQISFSASNNSSILNTDTDLLKLLVHSNSEDPQDFSNATVYNLNPISAVSLPGGNVAAFANIPVSNGMYFTLGNSSNYFNTPLPIELLSFDAKLNSGRVDLSWVTSTEVNNEYFLVERAGSNFDWRELMTVAGAGNSTSAQFYNQVDREPLQGISYYRLKQVDFDGAYTYSDIVSVQNNLNKINEVVLYPNPNNTQTVFIVTPAKNKGVTTISMTDIAGKVLIQKSDVLEQNITTLQYGDVPAGVYLITVRSSTVNETKKLIVK